MGTLYCLTSVSQCIIDGVRVLPWLIREIAKPCLTQLDSRPPFESSLHSQLWGAAHRGSQKHLQSWNSVWDLCGDYTGTSRVHILSHDSLGQNNSSPLFWCDAVVLGFKVWHVENNQKPNLFLRVAHPSHGGCPENLLGINFSLVEKDFFPYQHILLICSLY